LKQFAQHQLINFIAARSNSVQQKALETFNSPIAESKIPHPILRAALASLAGTVAEAAIERILTNNSDNNFIAARFGRLAPEIIAIVSQSADAGGNTIIFNEKYQFEHCALLAAIFAREVVDQDSLSGREEEICAHFLQALVFAQQLLTDATIASPAAATAFPTELARRQQTNLLALFHSGKGRFPNIGIFRSPNGQLFPGPDGRAAESFSALFAALASAPTMVNEEWRLFLRNIVSSDVAVPELPLFSDYLQFIDEHQSLFSAEQLVELAHHLRLILPPSRLN
jgi:hypothetical protein